MRSSIQVVFLCLLLVAGRAAAQPQLPNIAGASEKGIVLLSWLCQYEHVKTIAVRRSREAGYNYKIIGYVKKLDKGQQAFADGHPEPGKNYYKLNVVFISGLEWSSNFCEVNVDTAVLESRTISVPSNDTLQKYLDLGGATVRPMVGFKQDSARLSAGHVVSVSFDTRGVVPADVTDEVEAEIRRSRIKLVLPKDDVSDLSFIRSKYVSVLNASGHVEVKLPGDHGAHTFSLKFYDQRGKVRVDIPSLTEPIVIIDKRNFQRKGSYRFVLKCDGVEYETGYVNVTP